MNLIDPKKGPLCQECPLYEIGIPVADYIPFVFHGLSLVGEMPGRNEVKFGSCFVGQSGKLLDGALGVNSLTRENLHITNVIRCGLTQGGKPEESFQKEASRCCLPLLCHNLESMGTSVACAVGGVPWEVLTGMPGIDKYRGVIIPPDTITVSSWGKAMPWYVTGTLHPAGLLRVEARRIRADLLIDDLFKAYRLATNEIELWEPTIRDPNDYQDLLCFLINDLEGPISCDVETDGIDALTCNLVTIGIAGKSKGSGKVEAWPIPYHPNVPGFYTDQQWKYMINTIKHLLADPTQELVFHNMSYDIPVLERHLEVDITADCHDTLLLHHAVYPKLPHNLESVASQFLPVEPWKSQFSASSSKASEVEKALSQDQIAILDMIDGVLRILDPEKVEEEEPDDHIVVIKSLQDLSDVELSELLYYNGCDCAATLDLFHILSKEAKEIRTYPVYEGDRVLVRHTIDWYYAGVAIDESKRAVLEVQYKKEIDNYIVELRDLCNLPSQSEQNEAAKPFEVELQRVVQEMKDMRTHCAFCDYVAKSGPDQCRHVTTQHAQEARAIARSRRVDFRKVRSPAGQEEAILEAVKGWLKSDLDATQDQMKQIQKEIRRIRKSACAETFNPGSPPQLRLALKSRGLTPTKLTKKSKELSTSKDSLWELRGDPLIDTLFKYRERAKLYSTYIVGLPNKLGPDGRLHPVWKLHSTPSGRFGTAPAIQNWPSSMREMIIPDPGNVIVTADFSALELRISALLAGQQDLIDAFLQNADIHARNAGFYFPSAWPDLNRKWEASSDDEDTRNAKVPARMKLRDRGKNVTFGKIYGAGAETLYMQIREKLDDIRTPEEHRRLRKEVAAMSAALDLAQPNIPEWSKLVNRLAEESLSIRTALSGRIRKWPMGEVPPTESANHPIQGLAADIMNVATLRLIKALKDRGWYCTYAWIIMQIHDAIYIECNEAIAYDLAGVVEECLRTELTLASIVTGEDHTMVFPADSKIGYNAKNFVGRDKWLKDRR